MESLEKLTFNQEYMSHQNQAELPDHHEAEHENKADELWQKSEQNEILAGIKEGKSLSELLDAQKLAKVFAETPCCLGCSDGRIHENRIARAGMGIVAGVEDTVNALKAMFESGQLDKSKELVIKSHDGCGAAKIVCNQLIAEGKLDASTRPDALGIDFAREVVDKLNEAGYSVRWEHTEAREMDGLHDERAIYYDGTGTIDLETLKSETGELAMPRGFVFTAMKYSHAESTTELKALCGIALGDHGFGNRFTSKNPFRIFVAAKDQDQLTNLMSTAEQAAQDFEGRVVVQGEVLKLEQAEIAA